MSLNWRTTSSGLRVRDDEYSWQGSSAEDPRFFLRRDKFRMEEITDLLVGDLSENQVAYYLTDFLAQTGGVSGDHLLFSSIASASDAKEEVVASFDRIDRIVRRSMEQLSNEVVDSNLDFHLSKWNAQFRLM